MKCYSAGIWVADDFVQYFRLLVMANDIAFFLRATIYRLSLQSRPDVGPALVLMQKCVRKS